MIPDTELPNILNVIESPIFNFRSLINFSINSKVKINDFTKTLNKILKIKIPIFPIDGENLKQKGMQEGQTLGIVLNDVR